MLVDNRTDWLKARRKGIGGSDAASVLGISPWKSNVQLWEEKTGIAEPEDISDKEVVRFGKESEAAVSEAAKVLRGNEKAQQAFREIGTDVQKKVQKRIDEGQFVPNAPSTIKRKGHDHPLIDTRTMRDSISYTVCEKGEYD